MTARACFKSSNYGGDEHLKHLLGFHHKLTQTYDLLLTLRPGVLYVCNNSVGGGRYVLKKEWSCLNVCTFYLYILISAMPLLCRNRCQCRPSFIPTNSDHLIKHTTHSLNHSIISHCNTVIKRRQ